MSEKNPKSIAREYAFSFLYGYETGWNTTSKKSLAENNYARLETAVLEFELSVTKEDSEVKLDAPNIASQHYSRSLIKGVLENEVALQEIISSHTKNATFKKIIAIDRTILVLAVFELKFTKDTPRKVVISEALTLASKYGGDASSSFINGILDKIL